MKIQFENVSFYYDMNLPGRKIVLNEINLTINDNEFVGVIGPSGSGKTTLVQHFTGLLKPTDGKVFINDVDISSKKMNMNSIRQQIGIVFQFPESQLFEETVYDDIAFGPKSFGLSTDETDQRVKETFKLLELDYEKLASRSPFKLSEGEKRKVALAGIIVMNPDLLILDEPTACLDASGITRIENLLVKLHALGKAIVLVSHNLNFIIRLCKRIVVLQRGQIMFDGTREQLLTNEKSCDELHLELPRVVRYCRKLLELGYITEPNIYSIEKLRHLLSV